MAYYFEKALPKAISFYKKVATDKEFAKDILNEIKNVADTDQFVEYYKNFTLEQFMADFKALLSANDENNSQIASFQALRRISKEFTNFVSFQATYSSF